MSKFRLNRRSFMALAGAGAAGLMLPRGARAQLPPPRFLFIYGEGGWTARATFMRPSFAPADWGHWSDIYRIAASGNGVPGTTPEESAFDFPFADPRVTRAQMSQVLDPFWDVRSKMLAFEGMAMLSTAWDPHGDGHATNHLATSTAGPAAYEYDGVKSFAAYPSIDQRLLAHFQAEDPLAFSLNFNANVGRNSGTSGFHYFLYRANAAGEMERLAREGDPSATFARLFGGLPPGDDEEQRARAQEAVFTTLDAQFRALHGRSAGRDAMRVEAHRATLANLAARLQRPPVACEAPTVGAIDGLSRAEAYESDWQAFGDMVIAAFGCGVSRVASMSVEHVPPEAYGPPAEAQIHHEYEHESNPLTYYGPEGESGGDAAAEAGMIDRNVHRARMVANLVARLDEIPEAGGTMLDNTIVLLASELAHGSHGSEYCPFVVLGGSNYLNTGRYIKYAQNNPNPWHRNYANEHTGMPHSRLYLTLLRQFGLDIDFIHEANIEGSVPHGGGGRTTYSMSDDLPGLARS